MEITAASGEWQQPEELEMTRDQACSVRDRFVTRRVTAIHGAKVWHKTTMAPAKSSKIATTTGKDIRSFFGGDAKDTVGIVYSYLDPSHDL